MSSAEEKKELSNIESVTENENEIESTDGTELEKSHFLKTDYMLNYEKLPSFLKNMNIIIAKDGCFLPNEFTVLERRIIGYAIATITKEQRELPWEKFLSHEFYIDINYFKEIFKIKKTSGYIYEDLKEAGKRLTRRPTELRDFLKGKNIAGTIIDFGQHEFNWIDFMEFIDGEHKIKFRFSQTVMRYIHNLTNKLYVSYNLFLSHGFKSSYAIKMYEIMQTRKDSNMIILGLDEFKQIFSIPNSYKKPSMIVNKVLLPTQEELNEKLNLGFEFMIEKDRRYSGGYVITLSAKINNDDLINNLNTCFKQEFIENLQPIEQTVFNTPHFKRKLEKEKRAKQRKREKAKLAKKPILEKSETNEKYSCSNDSNNLQIELFDIESLETN